MFRPRRRRLRSLNFNVLIPNILTLLATCAGLTAIRWGLQEKWEPALLAVLAAAVLDALDGRIARLLKGTSRFGAELDSLSDFVAFGIVPALLMYLWALEDAGRFGWTVTLLFALAAGLRLARFNVADGGDDLPAWTSRFFTGVPAPAAAGLGLMPLLLHVQFEIEALRHPLLVIPVMLVVAGLMVSPIPTFSFKRVKVPPERVLPVMLGAVIIAASLITAPWLTVTLLLLFYLGTIPFSIRAYRALARAAEDHQTGGTGGSGESAQ